MSVSFLTWVWTLNHQLIMNTHTHTHTYWDFFPLDNKWRGQWKELNTHLVCVYSSAFVFCVFFFFWEKRVSVAKCSSSKSCALFMGPTNFFLNKTFIKNVSHGTIHTFKNYFTTMFLIFNKINDIQTDP